MGSLIRTTAEGIVNAAGQPVFDIVARIGFDLSELENAPAADVIIDFSNVATFDAVVAYVERTGAALVSAPRATRPIRWTACASWARTPASCTPGNYSIGIAALRHLVAQATRELPGFDCEDCRDSPQPKKGRRPQRHRQAAARRRSRGRARGRLPPPSTDARACAACATQEIGMHSLRGGTVAGVHEVSFFGQDEEVTLTHTVPRAVRSLSTAPWQPAQKLVTREPGFYTFDQVMFA